MINVANPNPKKIHNHQSTSFHEMDKMPSSLSARVKYAPVEMRFAMRKSKLGPLKKNKDFLFAICKNTFKPN
jgi:hypothetical protein